MGFGAKFRAQSRQSLKAAATPPSGASPESIWHQAYDTLSYTSGTTVRQTFFQATNIGNPNLTNMEIGGQFPSPQIYSLHNVCIDVVTTAGVSTDAATAGSLNDVYFLMLTSLSIWTLTISNKAYGPYKLSALHGTGGPQGFVAGSPAAPGTSQFGTNTLFPGWNYFGRIIIPEQTAFKVDVVYNAAQTLKANANIVFSLFGVLSRRVL